MKFSLILIFSLFILSTYAETTIKGEIAFAKKPPFAGVVYMSEDTSMAGKKDVVLDQKNKLFSKKIIIVPHTSSVAFKNSDEIDHNIFAADTSVNVKFDAGLVASGNTASQKASWREGTIARIGCKIHPKMRSYVAVVSSAYYAELELDSKEKLKKFELKGVPGDFKKVKLILPRYEIIEVEIAKGETKKVELKKPGKTTIYGTLTLTR